MPDREYRKLRAAEEQRRTFLLFQEVHLNSLSRKFPPINLEAQAFDAPPLFPLYGCEANKAHRMRRPDLFVLLLSRKTFRRLELRSAQTSVFGDSDEKIAYFQGLALGTVGSQKVGKSPFFTREMDHSVVNLRLDLKPNDQPDLEQLWRTLQACHDLLKGQEDFAIWFEEDCDQRPLLRHTSATIGLGQCLYWIHELVEGAGYWSVEKALLYDCPPAGFLNRWFPKHEGFPDVSLEEIRATSNLRDLLVALTLGKTETILVQEILDMTKYGISNRATLDRIQGADRLWKDVARRSSRGCLSREQAQECTAELLGFLLERWPMIVEPRFSAEDCVE